jgi:hypothetical protein
MSSVNFKSNVPKGFSFSQSSLQDYTECPRRFQLRYLEQLRWPAVETEPVLENELRQIEGVAFHRLIQQYLLGLPLEKISRQANTSNLDTWWKNFKATNFDIESYTHYTEITLSCPIGEHRLLAKYDLVAIKPLQKALIFDWKTYAKRPRNEWMAARWQTRVYRAILANAGGHLNNNQAIKHEQIEMIFWYADYPTEPVRFSYDTQRFKRDWSAIEKVVGEISSSKDFPMTDDLNICRFCTYRSYCDRGRQAGAIADTDGDFETDETFDVNFEQIGEIEF